MLAVIIPAAGSSQRFGRDKLRASLGTSSVLEKTVEAFATYPWEHVEQIIVVGSPDRSMDFSSKLIFAPGGHTREQSVLNGLKQVREDVDWIAIHDAARPLVSHELIRQTFVAAQQHGAAAPALPVHLTIKQAGPMLPGKVDRTVPRHTLYAMQTPQIMRKADLQRAFAECPVPLESVTDDLQMLELAGLPTWLIPGDPRNIKITLPVDLVIAQHYLHESETKTG